jgi:ribosomal-protein-alanine N-acetyltransferase
MSIRINLARESDCAGIAEMSRRYVEAGLPWSWTESRVRHYVRHRDCAVIAARRVHSLVGFAIMEFHDAHAHLNLLAVRPGHRRRGVGRALIEWLEASARTAGVFLVRLELRAGNEEAHAFYRRLGYCEIGVARNYYAGREDAWRMQHNLSVLAAADGRRHE